MKKYLPEFVATLIICALVVGVAIQTNRLSRSKNEATSIQLDFEKYKLDAQTYLQAEQQRRAEEMEVVKNEAKKSIEQIKAEAKVAAATALDERNSMYERKIARLRAAYNTPIATGGQATGDPIGVLAHVLTSADQRAGILAEYADRSRAAGLACQAAYEALQ